MPLDPSIPLGAKVAQIESPLDALSKIAQLQESRSVAEARRLAAEEARTKHLRQQQVDDAYAKAITRNPETNEVEIDYGMLTSHLPGSLIPGVIRELQTDKQNALNYAQGRATLEKTQTELAKLHMGLLAGSADTVIEANGDPVIWGTELRALRDMKAITPEQFAKYDQERDPSVILAHAREAKRRAGLSTAKPALMNVPVGGVVFDQELRQPVFTNTPTAATANTEWVLRDGEAVQIAKGTAQPGDVPYRAPVRPPTSAPSATEWVLRNNEAVQIPKGTAQPGDVPYRAPTAAAAQEARKFRQATPVFNAISELSEKINTQQGLMARMAGGAAKIAAQANYNDDVAEYEALVSGFTPLVARALGHTGVLTEQDVQSVRALFPKPGDSKSLRDRKIRRVTSLIGELEQDAGATTSGGATGTDEEADFDFIPGRGLVPRTKGN